MHVNWRVEKIDGDAKKEKRRGKRIVGAMLPFIALSLTGAVHAGSDTGGEIKKIAHADHLQIRAARGAFSVKSTYGAVEGKTPEPADLKTYEGLFACEFGLYPPELIKRTHLRSVVFCGDLSFAGQRRNAVPDYEHDTLYLDVSRGSYSKPYQRKVIHHEFFHIIDYKDDGDVYRDDRWAALNPAGFHYGSGGKNAQTTPQTSVLTDKLPGFLNDYATTGVEEDKAEVFANLLVNPAIVTERAEKDVVLKAKVARLKEILKEFCPDMNDAFWNKVGQTERGPSSS